MTRESRDITRKQLIGMVAALRGELFSLLNAVSHNQVTNNDIEEAGKTLGLTTLNLSKKDEVDGGFDKSWIK